MLTRNKKNEGKNFWDSIQQMIVGLGVNVADPASLRLSDVFLITLEVKVIP